MLNYRIIVSVIATVFLRNKFYIIAVVFLEM